MGKRLQLELELEQYSSYEWVKYSRDSANDLRMTRSQTWATLASETIYFKANDKTSNCFQSSKHGFRTANGAKNWSRSRALKGKTTMCEKKKKVLFEKSLFITYLYLVPAYKPLYRPF